MMGASINKIFVFEFHGIKSVQKTLKLKPLCMLNAPIYLIWSFCFIKKTNQRTRNICIKCNGTIKFICLTTGLTCFKC